MLVKQEIPQYNQKQTMSFIENNSVYIKANQLRYHILLVKRNAIPPLKAFYSSKERDNNGFTKPIRTNQLWARCKLKSEISEAVVSSWSSFHKQICVTSAKKANCQLHPSNSRFTNKVKCCSVYRLHFLQCISFCRHPENMVFPKKLHQNTIFLALSGKMIFLLTENMILPLEGK